MKSHCFAGIVVAIVLLVSIVACSGLSVSVPTATPQPTYTPLPTSTPYPTVVPPTEVPPTAVPPTAVPAATFPAKVMVNGVDPVKLLESKGFTYAGGTDVGGCTSACVVYDDKSLGLSADVYADSTMVFSVDFSGGFSTTAQVDVLFGLIAGLYGHDMQVWINNANGPVLGGTAQDGMVGNFAVHMEFYKDVNLLVIAIAP